MMFSQEMARGAATGSHLVRDLGTGAKGAATGSPGLAVARTRYSRRGMRSEYMEGTVKACVYTHVLSAATVSHSV